MLLWPLVQVVLYSFQNYGLPQVTGALPTQWVGFGNFTSTFTDPEFWLSLRTTVLFAAVVVPLTLVVGTLVGLLLNRLGKKMSTFVSHRRAAGLGHSRRSSASVLFYWLFNPDGGLVDWALSKMPHWLVGSTDWAAVQLDHHRRAARLHRADASWWSGGVPVHRRHRAGRR